MGFEFGSRWMPAPRRGVSFGTLRQNLTRHNFNLKTSARNSIQSIPNQTDPSQRLLVRVGRWIVWLLLVLVTLLLLAKVVFSLNIIWQIFQFPFQTDESEGMIVAEVHLMDTGTNIYALPGPHLFVSAPYPPLYYLLNWPFLHLGGLSFKPGRAISLLATVGIAFLLYKLAVLIGKNQNRVAGRNTFKVAGAAAALFWATLGLVAFWGDAVKPDMTALFFSLGGIYLVASWANSSETVAKTSPALRQFARRAEPRPVLQLPGLSSVTPRYEESLTKLQDSSLGRASVQNDKTFAHKGFKLLKDLRRAVRRFYVCAGAAAFGGLALWASLANYGLRPDAADESA